MAEFPTYEQMAKNVAEKALDDFLYNGKSIREWVKIIVEQEPKTDGDCISRKAVLDGIDTYINKAQSTGTQDDFYSFAELVVKALPPITPKPKTEWIPVSEKLPEADGRYLCTYEDDIEENCVDFGSYENGEWYVDKVIAWMPLPKPYKEG